MRNITYIITVEGCRQLDPTGDTESLMFLNAVSASINVADNSIRPGILKESKNEWETQIP